MTSAAAARPPLLMTPGPTRVPARVLAAGARPMVHHRSASFMADWAEMIERIGPLFGARDRVLPIHTTGRGAMESVIGNLCSAGDEILVVANGRFGELWALIAAAYGLTVHRVATTWDRDADPPEIAEAFERHPGIHAVALAHSDTSTGVANDVQAIARIARAHNALVFVDGVSSIGGMPFDFDAWEVDAALTASQKCLMSSPGLAFVALSTRAIAATATATLPRSYWDYREIRQSIGKPRPEPPGTPPVHVVLQVVEALRMIHEEGIDRVHRRHADVAARARQGVHDLGLSLQCPALTSLSTTLTAVAAPAGMNPRIIRDRLEAAGVLIASGLGPYDASAFRIGHMGDIRMPDLELTLTRLATVLEDASRPA